ncbi:DUF4190 domain-containing protein [Vallitalea pronyensis]|uniref:DUF4190 domain-containing protein n=1 Tax=Vallitalea pronyensis TaxID=1348613 RepID=A0A8J8MN31_9FIRM|nr:DUF4190 domain-containing protein [Vallitalea pronyensis]QUI24534.1 DUF4190 domain-containing protein [Vallitalea pronyensis]
MSEINNPNQPVNNKGLAIASMVCGIVGIVTLCIVYLSIPLALLAIIFGGIMINANKTNPNKEGRGMAIAGLVLGIITIGLIIILSLFAASGAYQLSNLM